MLISFYPDTGLVEVIFFLTKRNREGKTRTDVEKREEKEQEVKEGRKKKKILRDIEAELLCLTFAGSQ